MAHLLEDVNLRHELIEHVRVGHKLVFLDNLLLYTDTRSTNLDCHNHTRLDVDRLSDFGKRAGPETVVSEHVALSRTSPASGSPQKRHLRERRRYLW